MGKPKQFISNNLYLLVARSIVVDRDGKVLLVKRSKNHSYYPQQWELPGGRLHSDTDSHLGLISIVHRETGLVIDPISKRFYTQSRVVTESGKYQGYVYVEISCESSLVGGIVRLDKAEHSDFAWVSLNEAFSYELTLESKKALAQYFSDKQIEKSGGKYAIKLISRALIKNAQNKYLVLKRKDNVNYPNTWELPGGKFYSLETLPDLLKREVFEETGYVVKVIKEVKHFTTAIAAEGRNEGVTFVNIISEAELVAGKLKLSKEHQDAKWVTAIELMALDLAPYVSLPLTELFLKL